MRRHLSRGNFNLTVRSFKAAVRDHLTILVFDWQLSLRIFLDAKPSWIIPTQRLLHDDVTIGHRIDFENGVVFSRVNSERRVFVSPFSRFRGAIEFLNRLSIWISYRFGAKGR